MKSQGYQLVSSFQTLYLGGCDVVLKVKWLETLIPIMWGFLKLSMKFTFLQKVVVLQRIRLQPPSFEGENKAIIGSLSRGRGSLLKLCGVYQVEGEDPKDPEISRLLTKVINIVLDFVPIEDMV